MLLQTMWSLEQPAESCIGSLSWPSQMQVRPQPQNAYSHLLHGPAQPEQGHLALSCLCLHSYHQHHHRVCSACVWPWPDRMRLQGQASPQKAILQCLLHITGTLLIWCLCFAGDSDIIKANPTE